MARVHKRAEGLGSFRGEHDLGAELFGERSCAPDLPVLGSRRRKLDNGPCPEVNPWGAPAAAVDPLLAAICPATTASSPQLCVHSGLIIPRVARAQTRLPPGGCSGQGLPNTPSWVCRRRLTGRLWNTTSCLTGAPLTHSLTLSRPHVCSGVAGLPAAAAHRDGAARHGAARRQAARAG